MKRGIPGVKTVWVERTVKLMELGFYFLSQFVQLTFSFCVVFLIYLDLGNRRAVLKSNHKSWIHKLRDCLFLA